VAAVHALKATAGDGNEKGKAMDIAFNCNKCGQDISIDETGAGQLVDCPKCGEPVEVPYKSMPLDKAATPSPVTAARPAEPAPVRASSLLPKILIVLVVIAVIVGGFFAYNFWKDQQRAKAEAAKAEAAKAEAARVKAEVEKAKRDFTVDVFIRTKGGESIKCGLVTVLVFDEDTIQFWQPVILSNMTDDANVLESNLYAAKTKMKTADSAWEAAKKNKEAAFQRWLAEARKARPDLAFNDDGNVSSGLYPTQEALEKAVRDAAPAAWNNNERWYDVRAEKERDRERAEKEWSRKLADLADWPQTVSDTILASLPQPVMATKTDADGRCAGKVPKPGRYAFAADFSRLVGDKSERDTWLIWVHFDDPTSKKVMLSNDNTLFSDSPDNVLQAIPTPKLPPDAPN
jgi:hypothetical protein